LQAFFIPQGISNATGRIVLSRPGNLSGDIVFFMDLLYNSVQGIYVFQIYINNRKNCTHPNDKADMFDGSGVEHYPHAPCGWVCYPPKGNNDHIDIRRLLRY
jgi:hypothetical protein